MTIAIGKGLFKHSLKNFRYALRYYRKRILLILCIITSLFLFMGFAARELPHEKDEDWLESGGLTGLTFKYVDEILGTQKAKEIADQVRVSFDENGIVQIGGKEANLGAVITPANELCKGIAILFVIITFFMGLLSMRGMEQMGEEFARRLVMLIFGFVLVYNAKAISFGLANLGSQVAVTLADKAEAEFQRQAGEGESLALDMKAEIYDDTHRENWDHGDDGIAGPLDAILTFGDNLGHKISHNFEFFIPWLALQIAGVVVSIVVWGRGIEILVMAAFSPLAFMEVPDLHHVGHGPGMRFIKNMLALSISGAIIVFIILATSQINGALARELVDGGAENAGANLLSMVVIGFVQAGAVMKASQFARSVVGVG